MLLGSKIYSEHNLKQHKLIIYYLILLKGNQKRNPNKSTRKKPNQNDMQPFNPQRFPAFFKRRVRGRSGNGVVAIPIGGDKTILFDTDVENNYFDRIEEPGELKIALLDFRTNETEGGDAPGKIDQIENVFNARKSSPQDGTIKIHLNPKKEVDVGDEARIKVSLSDPSGNFFEEIFWVKISEPQAPPQRSPKTEDKEIPNLGLPEMKLVHEKDWDQFGEAGETMDYSTVMYPYVEGEKLETIYINMDSAVLKNFKAKITNPSQEQLDTANRRYTAAVYSHTLFLYSITKAHKYKVMQEDSSDSEIDLGTYLKDLFESHYAEFLLNFGFDEIMQLIND